MENLQNLLKMKENEIEKLNNIRNTLKRKVVELNDAVSLKDIKITSLKEDLQEQIALNEDLKAQLEKAPPSGAPARSAVVPPGPANSEEVIRLLDKIVHTLEAHGNDISQIRQQLDNLPGGLQTAPPQASTSARPSRPSQYSQPSAAPPRVNAADRPNLRDRLKPAPSGNNQSPPSSPAAPKPTSRKSKMVPPIVNVKKIQNIESDSAKAPPIPDRPPQGQIAPAPQEYGGDEYGGDGNAASLQSAPAPAPAPKLTKTGPSSSGMPMGQYGVPTIPYPEDGLIKCPKCGGKSIQEMENRKKIVMFNPRKYGKKYGCKDCRAEWDYEY